MLRSSEGGSLRLPLSPGGTHRAWCSGAPSGEVKAPRWVKLEGIPLAYGVGFSTGGGEGEPLLVHPTRYSDQLPVVEYGVVSDEVSTLCTERSEHK